MTNTTTKTIKNEITENEQVVLNRIAGFHQSYYKGMYRDLYQKDRSNNTLCDKYCENFMRSTIEGIVRKLKKG